MNDREKVIKGLECCCAAFPESKKCYYCPYNAECYRDRASEELLQDALALLKEQEPVKPIWVNTNYERSCKCGKCGALINTFFKYCHECGRSVKWE